MANTKELKKVEEEIMETFYTQKECKLIPINSNEKKEIFFDTEPDLVAMKDKTLIIGEITVSGYIARSKEGFHQGANKKLTESFAKLYLYAREFNNKESELYKFRQKHQFREFQGYFIIPQGAEFLKGVGYRKYLYEPINEIMQVIGIKLSDKSKEIITRISKKASEEQKK